MFEHGDRFIRKLLGISAAFFIVAVLLGGDAVIQVAVQEHYDHLGLKVNDTYRMAPEVAWAGESATFNGAPFTPDTTSTCVVTGLIEICNPVSVTINFSNASPIAFTNASGTTTLALSTTGQFDITNSDTSVSAALGAIELEAASSGSNYTLQLKGASALLMSNTGATDNITSLATGVDAMALNAAGTTPSNLVDFNKAGVTQAFVGNTGKISSGSGTAFEATNASGVMNFTSADTAPSINFQSTTTGGTLASSATTNDIVGISHTCSGCTASAATGKGAVFGVTQPAGSNTNMEIFTYTGTGCNSAACFAQITSASNALQWNMYAPTNSSRFIINCPNDATFDVCTGASGKIFEVQKGGSPQLSVTAGGAVNTGGGDFTVGGTGNIIAGSSSTGKAEVVSGNASACGTTSQCTGAIVMGTGVLEQATTCAPSTSNASPSLLTLSAGCWAAKLTSGSASATVFTITYPGSPTLTNAPLCFYNDIASGITTEPTCTTSTTAATITYAVAPGAVVIGNIWLIRNGP